MKLTGIVLCGGQSTRMGTDKALLKNDDVYWAEKIENILLKNTTEVYYSVNSSQVETYSSAFGREKLIVDQQIKNLPGGLLGIMSCAEHLNHENLLVCPCDLQDITEEATDYIVNQWQENPQYCFFIPTINGAIQPLTGIYTAAGIHELKLKKEQLKNKSIKYILEHSNTMIFEMPKHLHQTFKNYNEPTS